MRRLPAQRNCSRILARRFRTPPGTTNCGACDNCLSPRATFDGTLAAQKFLSCVYRIREKNGFGVGLNHVVEVLTGADTEKIRKWGHEQLSTYGIGKEHSRPEWAAIGRELVRLGLSPADGGKIQRAGTDKRRPRRAQAAEKNHAHQTRRRARKPKSTTSAKSPATKFCSTGCAQLRKQLADERDVPAYIIFSDVALRQMARNYPARRKRVRPHQRRRRKEIARVRRDFPRRNRRAFADERPPDFCG